MFSKHCRLYIYYCLTYFLMDITLTIVGIFCLPLMEWFCLVWKCKNIKMKLNYPYIGSFKNFCVNLLLLSFKFLHEDALPYLLSRFIFLAWLWSIILQVNRIRELPQNTKIVATHTDGPDVRGIYHLFWTHGFEVWFINLIFRWSGSSQKLGSHLGCWSST